MIPSRGVWGKMGEQGEKTGGCAVPGRSGVYESRSHGLKPESGQSSQYCFEQYGLEACGSSLKSKRMNVTNLGPPKKYLILITLFGLPSQILYCDDDSVTPDVFPHQL